MSRPFVSCVTPTFNRSRFLPYLIYQFNYQTYPANLRELIIIDDSTTGSNEELVKSLNIHNNIKYIYLDKKIELGKKRNMLNDMSTGEIIVAFDDDDYYPPDKITHLVTKMQKFKAEVSGSSLLYVYFLDTDKIVQFGPYGPGHSTNGTLSYRKSYIKNNKHRYADDAKMAEEKLFLDEFKNQVLQLDPFKTILCIAHSSNTFDKRILLQKGPNPYMKETKLKLSNFVKDKTMLNFYHQLQREQKS